jgi:hypothetical protein
MNKIILGLSLLGVLGIVSCQKIPSNIAIYTVTDVDNNLILTINNYQELKVQLCGVDVPSVLILNPLSHKTSCTKCAALFL